MLKSLFNMYDRLKPPSAICSFVKSYPKFVPILSLLNFPKTSNPDFEISDDILYSENNTNLICEILKLDSLDSNEEYRNNLEIEYVKYINTPDEKFNNFVNFVQNNQHIQNDKKRRSQKTPLFSDDGKNKIRMLFWKKRKRILGAL